MEYKCKNYRTCKKDYSWNPSTCICENGNCLKSIVDDSVSRAMKLDMFIVSTNVTSTVSINCHNKKVRYKIDCYILHKVLLVIILLLTITIICYYYAKHRSKLKNISPC